MQFFRLIIETQITHAEVLRVLSRSLGEGALLNAIDKNRDDKSRDQTDFAIDPKINIEELEIDTFSAEGQNHNSDLTPFEELELAINKMDLSQDLENYLWTYPFYRYFIESTVELTANISPINGQLHQLADEAMRQAELWVQSLPLPSEDRMEATQRSRSIWLKFRSRVLKSTGIKPFLSVK